MTQIGEKLGNYPCTHCGCCSGRIREFTLFSEDDMRCGNCSCTLPRADMVTMSMRLYVRGQLTLKSTERLMTVAKELGVDENAPVVKGSEVEWYIDISSNALENRLELEGLRKEARKATRK